MLVEAITCSTCSTSTAVLLQQYCKYCSIESMPTITQYQKAGSTLAKQAMPQGIMGQGTWPLTGIKMLVGHAAIMHSQELSILVIIWSVSLSSWEVTFRSSNVNIACSTATSFSPLLGKVIFYRTFAFREPCKV